MRSIHGQDVVLAPWVITLTSIGLCLALFSGTVAAHDVARGDQAFLAGTDGVHFFAFMYLGAKHMVTGYDHLLYLAGVIFFLYRLKDVALYVTLFAIGHSAMLLAGVLGGLHANPHIVDAIIGASVAYKAFENMGGFRRLGVQIDPRGAVLFFGFCHGFGLATKLQDAALSADGLITNMLAFNLGVEFGQLFALMLMLTAMNLWRASGRFERGAFAANLALLTAGFVLVGYQLTGYFVIGSPV